MADWYTRVEEIPNIVADVRSVFNTGVTHSLKWRKDQLLALLRLINENEAALCEACSKDVHKSAGEANLTELFLIRNEIADAVSNLHKWTKAHKPSVPLVNKFDGAQIRPEPRGVVLNMSAWNYPLQLIFAPVVAAISAGNCCIIKPSELAPQTAQITARLVPQYMDKSCFKVINGGVAEVTELLKQKFDYILYTGSGRVGKIVMTAAAQHLTPVCLELGGKSPAIVDSNCDLGIAARRIAWGRWTNCGQTCVAADYILCEKSVEPKLVAALRTAIKAFYGERPQESPDYGRLLNANALKRVQKLMQSSGRIVIGGEVDEKDLYIAPTVLVDVDPESAIMQEEIFGPVLPIVTVSSTDDAIHFVNSRDKPLALYVFSNSRAVCEKVISRTSSGAALANDVMMHCSVPQLPFGGVGESGMGSYHGKHGFDMLSHMKPVMMKSLGLESVNSLRYPPLTQKKLNFLARLAVAKPKTGLGLGQKLLLVVIAGTVILAAKRYGLL